MKKQLLLLVMILLPMVASAHDIAVENADGVTIYYNYTNNGTELEVTFRGEKFDSYSDEYKGVLVIPDEVTYMNRTRKVTSIGWCAFYSCSLTSVTIGNNVTSIGTNSFTRCSVLTSITIPNSVTSIGNLAFANCYGLTSVTIGNSVTSIGENAFKNCSDLTSVTISDIAAWCKIVFENTLSNPLYFAHNLYLNGEEVKDLVLPNSVTSVGNLAFTFCYGLTSVTIPNSVTNIGKAAFSYCKGLTSFTIPNSVTSIGYKAFDGCDIPTVISLIENPFTIYGKTSEYRTFSQNTFNNATLYVPEGTIEKYKATKGWKDFLYIEEEAGAPDGPVEINGVYYNLTINGGSKIAEVTSNPNKYIGTVVIPESVTYEDTNYSVTSIEKNAFSECSDLTSITIPNSVTSIGYEAFKGCNGLKKVIVSDIAAWCGIKFSYDANPLSYARNLYSDENTKIKDLVIPNSVTKISDNAFYGCSSLTSVTIPNSVMSIGLKAFGNCTKLTSIAIPNSVTNIDDGTFWGCLSLTSVTIPNSVTRIGNYAFELCGLTSVTIPNSVTSIGENAFNCCEDLTSVIISNGVTSIGEAAFNCCYFLTSITIPQSVMSIGFYAFANCGRLSAINVDANNNKYDSRDNCNAIIETASNTLITGCKNTVIPTSVTSIGECSFSGCFDLTSITIPNSVTSIGEWAFDGCSGLTSVTIPNSVTSIGKGAFDSCDLPVVISLIENPFKIEGNTSYNNRTFSKNTFENATLYVPVGTIDKYKATEGWKDFLSIVEGDDTKTYKLIYMVDGEVINSCDLKYGEAITPEPAPTREGYTFSGWSEIPETMPAHDVTITGSFSVNQYTITYIIDGEVSSTETVDYGSTINPPTVPKREGYDFAWDEYPETMPAHDIEIKGSYTQIIKADPDLAINGKGTFIGQLGFIATLGQPYDSPELINPHGLSPIVWTSSNPNVATVDANGVLTLLSVGQSQIKATFAGNDEYEAGMAEYSLVVIESGYEMDDDGNVTITGGDQTGDVTIDATITINGQIYQVTVIAAYAFKDNLDITSLTIPEGITTIGDNAFNGCINLFVINIGKDVLKIGSMAFANIGSSAAARTRGESPLVVNCYAETVPDAEYDAFLYTPVEDATLLVNDNLVDEYKMTAPWCYFGKIMGFEEAAGINTISIDSANARIYDMQGNRLDNPQKGVNIIRMKDGKTKKIIVK